MCSHLIVCFDYQIAESEICFFVELYDVGEGAALNESARFTHIIIPESDSVLKDLIYFAVGSRLAVAHMKTTSIRLQVVRDSGTAFAISVDYRTQVRQTHEYIFSISGCHQMK